MRNGCIILEGLKTISHQIIFLDIYSATNTFKGQHSGVSWLKWTVQKLWRSCATARQKCRKIITIPDFYQFFWSEAKWCLITKQIKYCIWSVKVYLPVKWNTDLKPSPNWPTCRGSFSLMLSLSFLIPCQSSSKNTALLYTQRDGSYM